ncbi:MAG: type II secretion system GspH family protein, partial [Candidatus Gastranaerophilales bacterium]|nr:type II secretion system GspH family protein [Candidatus Gastranaerophilales bacterium]
FNFLCSTFALTKTCNNQKRNVNFFPAFTLAETLITLAIIGVVAAMTIPTVIANSREKATVVKVKKAYSILTNALIQAEYDLGPVIDWGLSVTNTGKKDENGNIIYDRQGQNDFVTIMSNYMNGTVSSTKDIFANYDFYTVNSLGGVNIGNYNKSDYSDSMIKILLPDGSFFNMGYVNSNIKSDGIDIVYYSENKSSYTVGKDYFYFKMLYDSEKGITKVIPQGFTGTICEFDDGYCDISNSSLTNNGRGCTAWIIRHENMNYMHCSGLKMDGNGKCK